MEGEGHRRCHAGVADRRARAETPAGPPHRRLRGTHGSVAKGNHRVFQRRGNRGGGAGHPERGGDVQHTGAGRTRGGGGDDTANR